MRRVYIIANQLPAGKAQERGERLILGYGTIRDSAYTLRLMRLGVYAQTG